MSETFECPKCGYQWPKGAHGGHSCSDLLLKKLEEVKAERDKFKYVPGVMRCAKCEFQCIKSVINMSTGSITAGNSDPEKCPNGCGPLWRMSWEDFSRDHAQAAEKYVKELRSCEAERDALRARIEDAEKQEPASKDLIRDVFLRNGFTIKEGCDDLKDYVFNAAFELLSLALPPMPVQQDVLDKPAQVGSGIFHAGVKTRLVVEAAQRLYENNSCNGD